MWHVWDGVLWSRVLAGASGVMHAAWWVSCMHSGVSARLVGFFSLYDLADLCRVTFSP